jgi:hypothetical protein
MRCILGDWDESSTGVFWLSNRYSWAYGMAALQTLELFPGCCRDDLKPSPATWRVILLYHVDTGNKTLQWTDMRDAAWNLQQLYLEGHYTGEHSRMLHLFFFLMVNHHSRPWNHPFPCTIQDVHSLLRTFDCSGSSPELSIQDTSTKLFLSAAFHIPVLSKIDERLFQRSYSTWLLSEHTM